MLGALEFLFSEYACVTSRKKIHLSLTSFVCVFVCHSVRKCSSSKSVSNVYVIVQVVIRNYQAINSAAIMLSQGFFLSNILVSSILAASNAFVLLFSACQGGDYPRGLMAHTRLISSGSFSEISTFMPGLKSLMQIATQLRI